MIQWALICPKEPHVQWHLSSLLIRMKTAFFLTSFSQIPNWQDLICCVSFCVCVCFLCVEKKKFKVHYLPNAFILSRQNVSKELSISVLVTGWGIWEGVEKKWEIGWFIGKLWLEYIYWNFIYWWCWKNIVSSGLLGWTNIHQKVPILYIVKMYAGFLKLLSET